MAKHTPGPWTLGESFKAPKDHAVCSGPFVVANVIPMHPTDNPRESNANARLIAAAPELLSAVVEAEAGIREAVRIMDLMGRGQDARNLAIYGNNLRAAIAKTETA